MTKLFKSYEGFCPICQTKTTYQATNNWFRGTLTCMSCPNGSVPRERALALVLEEALPNWRDLKIHECSPIDRGISVKLKREAKDLIQTQFYPDLPRGSTTRKFRNEDLQKLTFPANTFDLFISLDVMEHIPDPKAAIYEIWRHLKPGGYMLCTWPVRKYQVEAIDHRVAFNEDGTIKEYLKPEEWHGNPVDAKGALVTVDYGYDIHQAIALWAHFDVRVYRFNDHKHGILGEYTEVFLAQRRVFSNPA
ncbi:methyltransferase domain-containing protein [Ensifer adhaerens]|uniref:methyltransferase domain-containing protein n=1 Tax=Ensifer adhaerens TaxID=106592 RepID=UPI001CBBD501|nr:methyltransferase domain-containing protein [Ensifer adhaerens]UAX95114.1 methyltransferase domain-containing protein [Ensifer adhaerens]UAY02995.1 methyltransferase domain-containing protein [Ensifer adhaerens]UAY10979.1 methyltransferase domain-containing protein [Ensifer adhaerens]